MAKQDEAEHEPLTEEQRITALEERVGTNKVVLLIIALLLIIVISVSITVMTLSALSDDEAPFDATLFAELQTQIAELQSSNEIQEKTIQVLKKRQLLFQEQLESTSNLKLLNIVSEQERAHQEFLDALRSGMYDLAHMLPGSRTWLEVYGEKVDLAEAHSKSREKELKKLATTRGSEDDEDMW
jgi:hypothetical protein